MIRPLPVGSAGMSRRVHTGAGAVVVVTGAASGIGRATAVRFAREGATVHAADVDAAGVAVVRDALLAAGARAARPGGRVAVLDIDHERSRVGALASIVFLAWMGSRAFTGDEVVAMATEAGLRDVSLTYPVRLGGGLVVTGTAA